VTGNIDCSQVSQASFLTTGETSFCVGETATYSILSGDGNDNGVIDRADATLILKYSSGLGLTEYIDMALADYNQDGAVDIKIVLPY